MALGFGLLGAALAALAAFTAIHSALVARRYPSVAPLTPTSLGAMHIVRFGPDNAPRGAAMLVHGASGNYADLAEALAKPLVSAGFQVFSVDRPGHGWSERARASDPSSPEIQSAMIHEALLALGVRKAMLIVHSLGGPVGLAMALNAPQFVRALMLLAPVSHPWPGGVSFYYRVAAHPIFGPPFRRLLVAPAGLMVLNSSLQSVFAPCPIPPDYVRRTRLTLVFRPAHFKANAEDVVGCFDHVSKLSPRYGEIGLPVAIVTGERDGVVYNHIHAAGLMRQIADATRLDLPGIGHSPHFSATEATVAAILALDQRANANSSA